MCIPAHKHRTRGSPLGFVLELKAEGGKVTNLDHFRSTLMKTVPFFTELISSQFCLAWCSGPHWRMGWGAAEGGYHWVYDGDVVLDTRQHPFYKTLLEKFLFGLNIRRVGASPSNWFHLTYEHHESRWPPSLGFWSLVSDVYPSL